MVIKAAAGPNRRLGGAIARAMEAGVGREAMERILRQSRTPGIEDLLTGMFARGKTHRGYNALRQAARTDIEALVHDAGRKITRGPAAAAPSLTERLEKFKLQKQVPAATPEPSFLDKMVHEAGPAGDHRWSQLPPYRGILAKTNAGIGKMVAPLAGGVAGAGALAAGLLSKSAPIGEAVQSAGQAVGDTVGAAASTIHDHVPTEGMSGTLWRNAPYLAAGGAGALGLYALYRQQQADKARKQQLPTLNLLPKTAADRRAFIEECPLVAGFLVACHKAGLTETQMREKIAIACRTNDEYAREFAVAFEKLGADVPLLPTPGNPAGTPRPLTGLPDLTQPLPAEFAAPKPAVLPNAPPPESVAAYVPAARVPGVSETAPPLLANTAASRFEVDPTYRRSALEGYGSQMHAFYDPGSKEMAQLNSPNDVTGKVLRGAGRTAGAVGVGAGLAAGGAAAGVPASVMMTVPNATWWAGKNLMLEGAQTELMQGGVNLAAGRNPLDPKNTWTVETVNGYKQIPQNEGGTGPEARTWTREQLSPKAQQLLNARLEEQRAMLQAKHPTATPEWLDQQVAELSPSVINDLGQAFDAEKLLQEAEAAEASGQVPPEVEQQAVDNVTKETGAPPEPSMWEQMTPGQKWLLGAGLSLATVGLLSSLMSEEGGGLGSTLATLLGGGLALGAAAHGGMLGEGAQQATQAVTAPFSNLLSSNNMQPISRDQQQMLAAVRGADLDRYQQLRAGPNPNIPQIA